jgi:AraC-like DNA-binding protein
MGVHAGNAVGGPVLPASEAQRAQLVSLLSRHTSGCEGSLETPVAGLYVSRLSQAHGARHVLQQPAFGLIAQGGKQLMVGGECHAYDPFNYLVSSVHLPVLATMTDTRPENPYLGLRLELDVELIGGLIREAALPPPASEAARGIHVSRLDEVLLDAVLRLLRLLDSPQDIPVLAPMIKREIFYRLLMGAPGSRLRQIALQDSQTHRIARAIRHLREHFDQPLRIENLARAVHMSESSLHHHFKAVTAMTPLQFQKQLRLQEARHLMLAGGLDVAATAHRVGYESTSQFSREYRRQYGKAPTHDRLPA